MSCEQTKNQIYWRLFHELDEPERSELEDHLESCAACAAEAEREKAFLATLRERPVLEPSAALLAECRQDLMRVVYRHERLALQAEAQRRSPGEVLRQWFSVRAWWQPALTAVLAVAAFLGGWWVKPGPLRSIASDPSGLSIANISGVQVDPRGLVRISFDELQPRTLQGRAQDPHIQKFLTYAATNYANADVRLETIDILKERAGERDTRNTLLYLLGKDRNAGVRMKALEALKQYAQDPEVRQSLIGVLTDDDNPGMRVQAIDLLMEAHDRSLVGVLQGVASKEPNNYVRMRCRDALRDMNASVETF